MNMSAINYKIIKLTNIIGEDKKEGDESNYYRV